MALQEVETWLAAADRQVSCLLQVCKCLRFSGTAVPREYEIGFQRALWTFRHQRVFCPRRRALVHLSELPPGGLADGVLVLAALPGKDEADLAFLGPPLPDDVAEAISRGALYIVSRYILRKLPPFMHSLVKTCRI